MAIKSAHIALSCEYGSDELHVSEDVSDDEVVFTYKNEGEDIVRTVFVTRSEARQFAETILKVTG